VIIIIITIIYTPGSKDPRVKKKKNLTSKCWMAGGPAGQLAQSVVQKQGVEEF